MGKRQIIRKKRQQETTRRRLLPIGIFVVALVVILLLVVPSLFPQDANLTVAKPEEKPFPEADFNLLGSSEAPIKVVEFADYLCSHCQEFTLQDEKAFIETYVATGKVHYEYLSVAFLAPNQTKPIEATYCAGDQNAFWPYRDLVYANIVKTQSALNDNYLTAYARELKLDVNAFNSCLQTGKYKNKANENFAKAREANIPGTPTFMVNGVQASRLDLHSIVDSELVKAGAN